MQALCALPPPPNMIWHDPGFPSLLVTYAVASDFFFSGHTAIAVFGATRAHPPRQAVADGARVPGGRLRSSRPCIVLRAHYTMDVFAGIVAALWVAALLDRIVPPVDRRGFARGTG